MYTSATLQLKPIFEERGVRLDGMMPPTWASQWERRASKVTSDSFWWFGQGGEMPSAGALVRGADGGRRLAPNWAKAHLQKSA